MVSLFMNADWTWMFPSLTCGSVTLYLLVVYPLVYITVYRMTLKPTWELLSTLWGWITWFAGLWDSAGITPESIPRQKERANFTQESDTWLKLA